MMFGARWFARRRHQNEVGLGRLFLRRRCFHCSISSALLLRVSGFLEGGVAGSKLESITLTLARRSLLSGRSKACNKVKRKASSFAKKRRRKKLGSKDSQSIETEVGQSSLLRSRRRSTVQRLGKNCGIVVITRIQASIGSVLRILNNISNYGLLFLRRRP
jgi:hypothetical protein